MTKPLRRWLAGITITAAATTGLLAATNLLDINRADTAWGAADTSGTVTTDDTAWGTPPVDGGVTVTTGGTTVTVTISPYDTAWG
jgi:hypothetical protein